MFPKAGSKDNRRLSLGTSRAATDRRVFMTARTSLVFVLARSLFSGKSRRPPGSLSLKGYKLVKHLVTLCFLPWRFQKEYRQISMSGVRKTNQMVHYILCKSISIFKNNTSSSFPIPASFLLQTTIPCFCACAHVCMCRPEDNLAYRSLGTFYFEKGSLISKGLATLAPWLPGQQALGIHQSLSTQH